MVTKAGELREKIFDYLLSNLGGDGKRRITEEKIAKYFKTSRTPVREVLKSLEHEGLIIVRRNRGIRIKKFKKDDIKKIYDVRIVLEELAIREAVKNIKEDDIKKLKEYAKGYNKARNKRDRIKAEKYDILFHEKIVEMSGNWYLEYLMKKLKMFSLFFSVSLTEKKESPKRDRNPVSHNKIIKALITKNPEIASENIKKHILWALNSILKH